MKSEIFNEIRPGLMNLARRMLGSHVEAEDMVQEACLRWERTATSEVRSPKAFLSTIVTRLCLNHLDLARVRLEHEEAPLLLEGLSSEARTPAEQAELSDTLAEALQTVLGNLSPTERVVFLLREAFDFGYADIALVVDRTEENCRQILRRARERLAAREPLRRLDMEQNERVVSQFLNAAETGQFDELLQLLADDAALAPAPRDLTRPAPALIHDREMLIQTLAQSLAQMRQSSAGFMLFPIGQDYACVARNGRTAGGAVVLRLAGQKVTGIRVVMCPALLSRLSTLMAAYTAGDGQAENTYQSN